MAVQSHSSETHTKSIWLGPKCETQQQIMRYDCPCLMTSGAKLEQLTVGHLQATCSAVWPEAVKIWKLAIGPCASTSSECEKVSNKRPPGSLWLQ